MKRFSAITLSIFYFLYVFFSFSFYLLFLLSYKKKIFLFFFSMFFSFSSFLLFLHQLCCYFGLDLAQLYFRTLTQWLWILTFKLSEIEQIDRIMYSRIRLVYYCKIAIFFVFRFFFCLLEHSLVIVSYFETLLKCWLFREIVIPILSNNNKLPIY